MHAQHTAKLAHAVSISGMASDHSGPSVHPTCSPHLQLLDASLGMLYLHCKDPPIIHQDLKSPNLLVGSDWRVKVCCSWPAGWLVGCWRERLVAKKPCPGGSEPKAASVASGYSCRALPLLPLLPTAAQYCGGLVLPAHLSTSLPPSALCPVPRPMSPRPATLIQIADFNLSSLLSPHQPGSGPVANNPLWQARAVTG